jgi:ABC-type nitrate/sulfonate/bicarbonate transport system permease component
MKFLTSERLIGIASPLLLLLLWELCARSGVIDTRFFPAPTAIVGQMLAMWSSGEMWGHVSASLQRLAIGLLVGGVPAILIGITMGLYRPIYAAVDPLISATYPIPKSSLLPLMLLIFGLGESSKIVMVAIGAFYPIVINTAAGVRQIPQIFLDVGKNFKASRLRMFTTIALPGALPLVMTGIKLGVGMSLVLIAIAEMVGAKNGLGYMIWNAWEIFDVTTMYVGLFIIALIGFILNLAIDLVERLVIPWKHA